MKTKQQKYLKKQRNEAKMASSDLWNMAVGLMTIQSEYFLEEDDDWKYEDLDIPEWDV